MPAKEMGRGYQLALLLSVPAGLLLVLRVPTDSTAVLVALGVLPAVVVAVVAWQAGRRG